MGNDPVNGVDPNGGFWSELLTSGTFLNHAVFTVAGGIAGALIGKNDGTGGLKSAGIGAGIGFGFSFVPWDVVGGVIGGAGSWVGNQIGNLLQGGGLDGVVALVGGADLSSKGGIPDVTKNIESDLNSFYRENNLNVKVKSFSSDPAASTMDDVYNFLKKNSKKLRPVFVYGYSLGGHTANQAIKRLNTDNINVNLFYAVDAALSVF